MSHMVQELISQPRGLSQVPSRFIQPIEERPQSTDCFKKDIPIIDMEGMAARDAQS